MPNQATVTVILDMLREKQYQPSELLRELLKKGYYESDVKEAVAQLLHDQQIELSSSRQLSAVAVAA